MLRRRFTLNQIFNYTRSLHSMCARFSCLLLFISLCCFSLCLVAIEVFYSMRDEHENKAIISYVQSIWLPLMLFLLLLLAIVCFVLCIPYISVCINPSVEIVRLFTLSHRP